MNWPVVKLGEVAEIEMGQAPSGDSYNEDGDGVPLIAGASDFGSLTPQPSRHTSSPTKVSKPGDIVMCIRATIGDLNLSDKHYCLGRGVAGLRPKNGILDSRYLWRVLEASSGKLRAKGRGATFLQVSKTDISDLQIPLPSLPEQKRIAGILDQADALRRLRARALEKLYVFGQAVFRHVAATAPRSATLADLAIINPRRRFAKDEDFSVTFLPMASVSERGLIESAEQRMLADVRKGFTYFEAGDILVAKITPCFENYKGCLFSGHHPIGFGSTEFHVIRPNDCNLAVWLHLATRMPEFRQAGERAMTGSAGQKRVPASFLASCKIPLPDAALISAVNDQFQMVDTLRRQAEAAQIATQSLFTSLQHRAFRGEL